MRFRFAPCLLLVMLVAAGCSNAPADSVTAPSPSSDSITLLFEDALQPRGSRFYTFQVTQADIVSLTYASLTTGPRSTALNSALAIGIGVPNGPDCDLSRSVTAAPGLASQVTTATFAVRIVQRLTTATSTSTSRTTATFASTVALRGGSSHVFTVAAPGVVNVTLTSVGPPTVAVGIGLGITGGVNACTLTTTQVSAGGPAPLFGQAVDPGTYCVQVYDVGNLTTPSVPFSVTIDHP
jgi:hypothetical protein